MLLLDDDAAGKAARDRYREEWFLPENAVQTLGNFEEGLKGMTLEKLISKKTREMVQLKFEKKKAPSKKEIGLYLAEMCALGASDAMSKETEERLVRVLKIAAERLQ